MISPLELHIKTATANGQSEKWRIKNLGANSQPRDNFHGIGGVGFGGYVF
jgi:hypothetical protein